MLGLTEDGGVVEHHLCNPREHNFITPNHYPFPTPLTNPNSPTKTLITHHIHPPRHPHPLPTKDASATMPHARGVDELWKIPNKGFSADSGTQSAIGSNAQDSETPTQLDCNREGENRHSLRSHAAGNSLRKIDASASRPATALGSCPCLHKWRESHQLSPNPTIWAPVTIPVYTAMHGSGAPSAQEPVSAVIGAKIWPCWTSSLTRSLNHSRATSRGQIATLRCLAST